MTTERLFELLTGGVSGKPIRAFVSYDCKIPFEEVVAAIFAHRPEAGVTVLHKREQGGYLVQTEDFST